MKIAILGAGNMATAFASLIKDDAVIYSIDKAVADDINLNHKNSRYLDLALLENIKATTDLGNALESASIVVFAVPSSVFRSVCIEAKDLIPKDAIIVILSKGLDKSGNTMSMVAGEYFSNNVVSVGGPSIANEIALKSPCFVVFASKSEAAANSCKKAFERDYYNVSISEDIRGTELCGFIKNIYGIYFGLIDGKGFGLNAKSGLFAKVVSEMEEVLEKLGAKKGSAYSLAGIGDLLVTGFSEHGRNRRFGEFIALGKSIDEAKSLVGQTVEGLDALAAIMPILKEKNIAAPIIEKINGIVFLNKDVSI
jgi:glycerol-3-phosphate dehydrogenase (NAD(P)+)